MYFNEGDNFTQMLEKKKAFYQRMKDDLEFRLKQVDKKIMTMNALSSTYYTRYQMEVYDNQGNTYKIGNVGQLIPNNDD